MENVTVVIPCYNSATYIDRCINSLKKQEYKNFEVIFVDDASEDNTVERLKYLTRDCEFKTKILVNSKNSGPAFSRNRAICMATTKMITFCDADDWYETQFLKVLADSLEQNNADLAFCGYTVVDESGNSTKRVLETKGVLEKKEDILRMDVDSLCMLMTKTSIMKKALLPNIRNGEDMAVIPVLMLQANKCIAVPDCLYNYYRRSNSASEIPTMRVVDSLIKSFDYIQNKLSDNYIYEQEYLGVRNLLYASTITIFSISFDKNKAREILDNFEKKFPNWWENTYINQLPFYKKVVLKMMHRRFFLGIWIMAKIRSFVKGRYR